MVVGGGEGGGSQSGHKIVPSEGKGHQSVGDSSEESRRRLLTSRISPPLTSNPPDPPTPKQEVWLMSHYDSVIRSHSQVGDGVITLRRLVRRWKTGF